MVVGAVVVMVVVEDVLVVVVVCKNGIRHGTCNRSNRESMSPSASGRRNGMYSRYCR